ncbi:syndetin-like [Paramacrobiotus metropolitanus]|uniref:syndetin-like n=1 Tax=Paramacrobiotus metropolitanus TaxID=2943436 RepID=UPI002445DECC|nr:syndetin-like [Paramacrobiotus metropolitanus]XP_055337390.1 syndetin-like [Paramacrobiotus metropolitanus]XP_055337391.1 syndetin-like [Paramacrobiotus metropolitanus]XP_055337392.1 syndetin-like [Paramacrobiotus metropolitanus]XP_055337393.1 syndetin-like [Paramacrobiotus metropolitanus]
MDLKNKLRSLVRTRQDPKTIDLSPSNEENLNSFTFEPTVTIQPIGRTRAFSPADPHAENEILKSIEEIYYSSNSFDASDYELQKLNGEYELGKIDQLRKGLKSQLEVVTKTLSEIILKNQAAYTEELKRVTEIENDLGNAVLISKAAREATRQSHDSFAAKELKLLQLHKRGQHHIVVLRALTVIKTLRKTMANISDLIEEGNFTEAIQLTLTCRHAAKQHRQYGCISQLHEKLQDTLMVIEQRLDTSLGQICLNFDAKQYARVYNAYQLLDKNQTAVDQLHMHFITTIHNRSFGILLGFVELANQKTGRSDNFIKKPYQELCQAVPAEFFVLALYELCKGLWEIMKIYRTVVRWHLDLSHQRKLSKGDAVAGSTTPTEPSADRDLVEVYVLHKLESGPPRLWSDMEQKVRALLTHNDAATQLKYDTFGHLLAVLKRFCAVGKEFGGVNSDSLMDAVKQQASRFFSVYHKTKLEELHFFIDNECWEVCPMKSHFTCYDLWEFEFLRPKNIGSSNDRAVDEPKSFFDCRDGITPFDNLMQSEEHSEDVLIDSGVSEKSLSDSDEDVIDELKQDAIDETGERRRPSPKIRRSSAYRSISLGGPVVTNSTLTVLRLFGRYIFFVTMLDSIAPEVVNALSHLFDYYMYTVFTIFSTDIHEYFEPLVITKRLQTAMRRIRENLITANDHVEVGPDGKLRIPTPHLSPTIDVHDTKALFALPERIAAMESLAFLSSQMELIQPHLEKALPPQRRVFLQQFYAQSVALVNDLRAPVYWFVAFRTINYDKALTMMADVAWDIKDLASQHSEYVDHLLSELDTFNNVIRGIGRSTAIPKETMETLWSLAILLANRTFVEGYANAKKCTNEGRALMQLDYQQFLMKAEKLTSLRPLPDRDYVDNYIKAFYLPEDALDKWVKDHREYTLKHVVGLINHSPSLSKKTRQRLLQFVEDPEGLKGKK